MFLNLVYFRTRKQNQMRYPYVLTMRIQFQKELKEQDIQNCGERRTVAAFFLLPLFSCVSYWLVLQLRFCCHITVGLKKNVIYVFECPTERRQYTLYLVVDTTATLIRFTFLFPFFNCILYNCTLLCYSALILSLLHVCRASNSPALRGSLPPGHHFSRSPGKHVKSPTSMKKIPPSM